MSYKIKTKYEGQGVYAIFNRDQYKVYVGSTQEILRRAKNHQSNFRTSCILKEQWRKRREKREQDTTSDS